MSILYAAPLQVAGFPESCCALLQEALLEEREKAGGRDAERNEGQGPSGGSFSRARSFQRSCCSGLSSGEAAAEEGTADDGQQDALDAFMSDVQHHIEEDKVCGAT